MIKSVFNYPISTLLDIESNVIYTIPRYQREYTWGKGQWERLFDDLIENDSGYFLGSIICINQAQDTLATQSLEVVDGQQRMTTISLLLAAVYSVLKSQDDLSDEENFELLKLKGKLVLRRDPKQSRLIPQVQNSNQQDYFYVLCLADLLKDVSKPANAGKRRLVRAYRYFVERINSFLAENDNRDTPIQDLLEKVNTATLVKIEVGGHSDAYTLFESLNNRGVPLTAIDLIKNKLLATLESTEPGSIDENYDKWKRVMDALGDDYAVQERFFRQYYNAYRTELRSIIAVPVATKSNLMQVYEKLISHDPQRFLAEMVRLSAIYANLTNSSPLDNAKLSSLLLSLERIQAASAYLLLLILFDKRESLSLSEEHFEEITEFLIRFFVRRNTTDLPPTRDLNRIFMDVAESCLSLQGKDIVVTVKEKLTRHSSSDEYFKENLNGAIYQDNKAVCRFVLCALEEEQMTRERQLDLWATKGKHYVWTIEHIFPQGENIPDAWVDMIADGNRKLANDHREQYAHRLGNLTISGYNSSLGNKSFEEKQSRKDKKGRPVGYNNGLYLNRELADATAWTVEKIERRTKQLVDRIAEKYSLSETKGSS
ncbi:DUF262 domain-containing protein [Idiomarina sp. ST20R2A10]|uniref:DUF262 domain-containing protein n=1 Tax=Idiomarina sp. ST20R2A10 TaxID=3418369 RepID=UPI003EC8BA8A